MSSNTPFSMPSSCGCGGAGGPDGSGGPGGGGGWGGGGFGRPDIRSGIWVWPAADPAGATNVCGNYALSPIDCGGCCGETIGVLPPYVPSAADLTGAPVCRPI